MPLTIPPSGLYYPNRIARIYLEAAQACIGKDAFTALLRGCRLEQYADALPPDNLQRQFDFAHFSTISAALDTLQTEPPRTPPLAVELGRYCFKEGLKAFGGLSALGPFLLGFQSLPPNVRIKIGLIAMAAVFTTLSDQHSDVQEYDDHFVYVVHKCPICWGRHSATPLCGMAGAMLDEGLYWAAQQRFSITETQCHAVGDEKCAFRIDKL